MYLREGVLAVRTKLGELQPWLWSDDEIVDELNVSAQRMCSAAQCLNGFATFDAVETDEGFAQEYVLPEDVDQLTGASYLSGSMFPLVPTTRESVQLGGFVSGLPMYFYEKKTSKFLTPQVSSGGISSQPLPPDQTGAMRTVIGFWPVPSSEIPFYIWYIAWHPKMVAPFDVCQIPARFKDAWVSWCVARMKEKESALDEAKYYDAKHEKGTQDFVEYMITNGQEIAPPVYSNRPLPPSYLRGASSVIVVAQNPNSINM